MSDTKNFSSEKITLKLDNGKSMEFAGAMIAETSWYDEVSESITRQRIYETDKGTQVYAILEGDGATRSSRGYSLAVQDSVLCMSDAKKQLDIPHDLFMLFAKDLLAQAGASSDTALEDIEELLKAANC